MGRVDKITDSVAYACIEKSNEVSNTTKPTNLSNLARNLFDEKDIDEITLHNALNAVFTAVGLQQNKHENNFFNFQKQLLKTN